jgi:hypothetical protein
MIKIVSRNKNLLTNIIKFSNFDDIISLKKSNKSIKYKLNATKNEKMNQILLYQFLNKFRSEEEYEIYDNQEEIIFDIGINFEEEMKKIKALEEKMKLLDKNIIKSLDFIYKYHIYLPDLKKNNKILEFNNSSIYMDKLYDYKRCQQWEKNFYGKQINEEYFYDFTGNKKIKPLREKLYYENELINLKEFFNEVKGNDANKKIFNELILTFNYEEIINKFEHSSENELKKMNPIFYFVLFNTTYFKSYLINTFSSIFRYKDSYKYEKFLKEFINQHNKVLNVILFINNSFNNINLVINNTNKFLNKNNKAFSLMNLYLKMYKETVFDKLINSVLEKFENYLMEQGSNIFEINTGKNNDCEMVIDNFEEDEEQYSDDDSNEEKDDLVLIKDIIEQLGNCLLDMELDENNINNINSSKLKLGQIYSNFEDVLIKVIKTNIENNLKKNNNAQDIFERIKFLIEADKNPKRIISNNIKIINKTKKKILEVISNIFAVYTTQRFNVFNAFNIYDNYQEDYSDFSEESEKRIKERIEYEISKIKNILIKNYEKLESAEKMVDKYIKDNGDNMIVLAKRLIYFYSKEIQFYEVNDKRIELFKNNDI